MRWIFFPALFSLLLSTSAVLADDCVGTSVEYIRSPKASKAFSVEYKENQWISSNVATGTLTPLPTWGNHAHLTVIQRSDGSFAILNPSANHHEARRLVFYDAGSREVRALSLADILEKDIVRVEKSISHIWWLLKATMGKEEKSLVFKTRWGTRVSIPWPQASSKR